MIRCAVYFFLLAGINSCDSNQKNADGNMKDPGLGIIEKFDPALDAILDSNARAEVIASGFEWCEGPLWLEKYKMLVFSDVPANVIWKWTEGKDKEIYLTPSGFTGNIDRGGEKGSNGLTLDNEGKLVICQHGNRQMARMDSPLEKPAPVFTTLAGDYNGKHFNSPNDAIYNTKGELFFTDPPYGLEGGMEDPKRELTFQGVYKVTQGGEVKLLTDTLTRPNGLAFLPGEKTLLVANSDPDLPNWYAFDLDVNGDVISSRLFFSAGGYNKSLKGLPDGLKTDRNGNVFATGPGGVWIFNSNGKVLGKIHFTEATSNIALTADEKTMFITAHTNVLRFRMRK